MVPGITSAARCGAYAGIPLTHRDHAQDCVLVTGHLRDGSIDLNRTALAQPRHTLVLHMSLIGLPVSCERPVAHWMPDSTPAALVDQGTTARQRVIAGTLASPPAPVDQSGVRAPRHTIGGEVVGLRDGLKWFEPGQGRVPWGAGGAAGIAEGD